MGQDLKISELQRATVNVNQDTNTLVTNLTQTGKFIIPSYVAGEGSRSIDLGQLFSIFKTYVGIAAAQAVQDIYSQGGGGSSSGSGQSGSGDDSGGGSSGDGQTDNYANQIANLREQISELRTNINTPANYPTTFIRLVSETSTANYQIPTGYGQRSSFTQSNPLVISVTGFKAPNFSVDINMVSQQRTTNESDNTKDNVRMRVNIEIKAPNGYSGGQVQTLVVQGRMSTSTGTEATSKTFTSLGDPALDPIPAFDVDLVYAIPKSVTIDAHFVTCSINTVELGSTATYLPSSQTGNGASGSITLPN